MGYLEITERDVKVETMLLETYETLLAKMPAGRLTSKRVKGGLYYYFVDETTGKENYIPKKKIRIVYRLKQKRWLEESVRILRGNLKVQKQVLAKYLTYDGQSVQARLSKTYSDALIEEYEKKHALDLEAWAKADYKKNPFHPEYLRVETTFGLIVRSKSEMLIAEFLHRYKIPFHYDEEIRVQRPDGKWKVYYADFVIKLPTGEIIIWEHFGRMGKEDYRAKNYERITDYFYAGYTMPKNLIITMDGLEGELDAASVLRVIEGQLLPQFK